MRNIFAILFIAVFLCSSAHAAQKTIGKTCNSDNSNIDWDTIGQCNGTVFQKGPLIVGTVTSPPYATTACDAGKAGMIQWTGTSFKSCNGSGWIAFGEGSFLGVSATNTAPARPGDITTGLFSDTASTVSIATAGVSRLTVTASGYVGIGVMQPTVDLTIGGSSFGLQRGNASPNSGFLRFGDNTGWKFHIGRMSETVSGAVNTDLTGALVTFTDRGNVGIGITSPAHALDVVGNINLSGYRMGGPRTGIIGYSGGDYSSTGYGYVPTTTSGQYLYGVNDYVSQIMFTMGGFVFRTAPNGTTGNAISFSTPMTILNNGNVGIGTANPALRLHIVGNNNFVRFENTDTTANTYTQIGLVAGSAASYLWTANQNSTSWGGANSLNIYAGSGGAMTFWTNATERMRIDASGNLTFGNANPYLTASSYFVIPGGAYFNSGTVYTEATIQARGGIHNDSGANLNIYGGTSGHTAFSGTVSASTPTASNHLATKAYVDAAASCAAHGSYRVICETSGGGDCVPTSCASGDAELRGSQCSYSIAGEGYAYRVCERWCLH
ncbi:MAG: hypothetical protein PHX43_08860 [Alphaproteobacteria bacterium]|nr:hypothetical protein [Alphaproteobacteria bacterium]